MTRESCVSSSNRVMQNEARPEGLKGDTATQTVFMHRVEGVGLPETRKNVKNLGIS